MVFGHVLILKSHLFNHLRAESSPILKQFFRVCPSPKNRAAPPCLLSPKYRRRRNCRSHSVQKDGAHADETVVRYGAAVNDRAVADGNAIADRDRMVVGDVENSIVLHIGVFANRDAVDIAAPLFVPYQMLEPRPRADGIAGWAAVSATNILYCGVLPRYGLINIRNPTPSQNRQSRKRRLWSRGFSLKAPPFPSAFCMYCFPMEAENSMPPHWRTISNTRFTSSAVFFCFGKIERIQSALSAWCSA